MVLQSRVKFEFKDSIYVRTYGHTLGISPHFTGLYPLLGPLPKNKERKKERKTESKKEGKKERKKERKKDR